MPPIEEAAPAKINLALHVTGQRADGYHLLESLVCFAAHGDTVTVHPAERLSLSLDGPFAKGLVAEDDNLVLRAARFLDPDKGARITLTKRLPVSSGIGGGSSDAAAALRALSRLWQVPLPAPRDTAALGADVPVCLGGAAGGLTRMSGIGETVHSLGAAPGMAMVLVNPGVAVPTPQIFRTLAHKTNPVMTPMPPVTDRAAWRAWLATQRNDLEAPALAHSPLIAEVLAELRALPGCLLARMSGSGATCFALFDSAPRIDALSTRHPDWWSVVTRIKP